MLVVAPITTGLMESIPVANAGLGSAINNAISRVGQPLVLAVLFVVISATFYGSLEERAPGLAVDNAEVQEAYQALNRPPADASDELVMATAAASAEAFHLAMLATFGLLVLGALTNVLGLRRDKGRDEAATPTRDGEGTGDAQADPARSGSGQG